jgi:hypothetical protein
VLLAFDAETHKILPGLLAPPPVCFSFAEFAGYGSDKHVSSLYDKTAGLIELRRLLLDSSVTFIGHNVAFDFAVACAADESLIPLVFAAYEAGQVRDTKLRAELLDIRSGRRQVNGSTMVLIGADWVRADYSLAGNPKVSGSKGLVYRYFQKDRSADKGPDAWRTNYARLEHLGVQDWPEDARQYAIEDAVDTLLIHEHQQELARAADYEDPELEGAIVNEREQVYAAFALHLVSCWGLRTDAAAVSGLESRVSAEYRQLQEKMLEEGLFRLEKCTAEDLREGKVAVYGELKKKKKATKAYLKAGGEHFEEAHPDTGEPTKYYWVVEQNVPFKYVKNQDEIRRRVEAAFKAQGLTAPRTDPSERSPDGETKMDADTLELCGDPLLAELGGGGPVGTILKTFVPALKRGTEVPINTRIQPLLNTGRPSAADPNIFNLPRKGGVRECFVPRPGYVYCSVDYDCAELRSHAQVLLWLIGESDAAAFFQKNPHGDPHLELAASILGITPEEALRRKKAGDPEVAGLRQMCKAVNFGLPGGMGPAKLVESARKGYKVHMLEREAFARKQQWKARWREMEPYFDWVSSRVGYGEGSLMQLRPGWKEGKKHRIRGLVGFSDGCNTLFQGLTADGAKHALTQVVRECYSVPESPLFGCRVVVFLYDEMIVEMPKHKAHAAAHRLAEVMRESMQAWLPDVPVTCSPALMQRWYKGAEPVYVGEGDMRRLVPWEPEAKAA